ncbi:hypothetical protein GCM10010464_04140 [Pseudonocardia yunnanensis]|uniref:Protein DpdJ n=1 Tax=Pseudonocardia yunnanensis TaxID=58107 RepID=A0ABW4ETY1_9PSEU
MTPVSPRELGAVLNRIEDLELPLLSWGYVEGALASAEVADAVEGALAEVSASATVEEALQTLEERGLLVEVAPGRWRSRLAETLRLATHLRQLLGDGSGDWWLRGRRLVGDFRIHVASRRYPDRDRPVAELLDSLQRVGPLGETARAVIGKYLPSGQDLARFQIDAAVAIQAALKTETTKAVIVAAGTGSGKTIAFYLPAFAWMAEHGAPAGDVQTLAIYPRTELLKDQVGEALRSALQFSAVLAGRGRRPLRIGTLYGDTPWSAAQLDQASYLQEAWRRVGDGRRCPYAACPDCRGDLLWRDLDRRATPPREQLSCARCGTMVPGEVLGLTRTALVQRPPDVLFTTTEMLNRGSSSPELGKLLGFAPGGSRPRLLLLDEVHTYEGVHGAQVALLLRRWRHAVGRPVTVVGLSATLRDSEAFMAGLVGIPENDVTLVEPLDEDLVDEGRQYQVALRGDPTSGASLLSTTIQTSMLLGRALDPPGVAESSFGSKGFLFTDDLDVTNRLFHNLRDAEGDGWMARRRSGLFKVLANLRSSRLPQRGRRDVDGQVWSLAERIGHELPGTSPARGLRISKTSSQDPGVADSADLVVATASLDVGFNDPRVGLVLQHKSPRDAAQFLQRRGRAGRTRAVRPITVVVLSDYGRDRLTYQAYDRLFDPELMPRSLPVDNRYVLRMQATFALKDWLTRRLQWRADAAEVLVKRRGENHPQREAVARLLEDILTDAVTQQEFAEFLRRALRVDAEEVQALLWDPPRALLTAVIPTLLRRARTQWRAVAPDPGGEAARFAPEFVPAALFAELNLPEVELLLPAGHRGGVETRMPVRQALGEAVPGRISKRFAVHSGAQTTWVPVPLDAAHATVALSEFVAQGSVEGTWTDAATGEQRLVVRPYAIQLADPPRSLAESSNSRPVWFTQVETMGDDPVEAVIPTPWSQHIRGLTVHTHANRRPVEVRRFTPGARARLRSANRGSRGAPPPTLKVSYSARGGEPAALGFALDVDGLKIVVGLPSVDDLLASPGLVTPTWMSARFRHLVAADGSLEPWADDFARPWLAQAVEIAIVALALSDEASVEECRARLTEAALVAAIRRLTGAEGVAAGGEEDPGAASDESRDLQARLEEAVGVAAVRDALAAHAQVLHRPPVLDDARFAQQVIARTVGAAVQRACLTLAENAQDDDLLLDVIDGDGEAILWLTESTVGGAGVIESIARQYAEDPRRFWRLAWSALSAGEYEWVDQELCRLVGELATRPGGQIAGAVGAVRTADTAEATRAALSRLHHQLRTAGYATTHALLAAVAVRVLRPGTNARFDQALHAVLQRWEQCSADLGFEIDARVWASLAGEAMPEIADVFRYADQLYSSLWPRGTEVFHRDLLHYAPYVDQRLPLDRHLTLAVLGDRASEVSVHDTEWRAALSRVIIDTGVADLSARAECAGDLKVALLQLSAEAIDAGYMLLHPVVRDTRRGAGRITARLELREAEQ